MIVLEHGKPLIFGKNHDKGIRLNGVEPEIVSLGNGVSEDELLVHDAHADSPYLAYLLSRMEYPYYPAPMGVLRSVDRPTYTEGLMNQIADAQAKRPADLNALYRSADLWEIKSSSDVEGQMSGRVPSYLDDEYMDNLSGETDDSVSPIQDILDEAMLTALRPKAPITVVGQTSLANALRLMNAHDIGCLLVTNEAGQLSGIFTERDVLMRVAGQVEDLSKAAVADYMTPDPRSLTKETPIKHALQLMSVHGFRHLPLVDEDGQPEGVISFRDVVRYMKENLA
jgi:CBS domain-containing protein